MERPKIEALRIERYLSIRDAVIQLRDLNVLIGANGAGKSNLISAFEFLARAVEPDFGLYVGRRGGVSALSFADGRRGAVVFDLHFPPYRYRIELTRGSEDEFLVVSELVADHGTEREIAPGGRPETRLRLHNRRILDAIRGWRVFHFHDTSADARVKQRQPISDNVALHSDGANLAPFLLALREARPEAYERIRSSVALVAPFFQDFVLEDRFPDSVLLRWRQVGSDMVFGANALSDGTLRFMCLVTLLLQPELPPLIVLDEPELGLHPFAIAVLADMLQAASRVSQVLVATQPVALIDQFEIEDLVIVERRDGASVFERRDRADVAGWLEDYSLGQLWKKNLLGGHPTREPGD
jgi:predicted ATPase